MDTAERLAYAWWNAATQVPEEDYRAACEIGWSFFKDHLIDQREVPYCLRAPAPNKGIPPPPVES